MCDIESFDHLAVGAEDAHRVKLSGPVDPSYHTRFLHTHLLRIVGMLHQVVVGVGAGRSLQGADKRMALSPVSTPGCRVLRYFYWPSKGEHLQQWPSGYRVQHQLPF